jgi:hypothetical protein
MSYRGWIILLGVVFSVLAGGCQSVKVPDGNSLNQLVDKLRPSNDRDWKPEMATLPYVQASGNGSTMTIKNIRNSKYVTADQYIVQHYDRSIELTDIESADYIVAPFNGAAALAHTMLSFGLIDGSFIVVSVEVRKERDEDYSAVLGLGRKFELMYVVGDEKDLIRIRTGHKDTAVYVYPTVAKPAHAQALFVDIMARVNKLAVEPEFYNTLTNNCTTNIKSHVNRIAGNRLRYDWRVLLPAHSAKYAYDLGLLDQSVPFEDLQSLALVNDLADKYYDAPDFSKRIRGRRATIKRLAERYRDNRPIVTPFGSGDGRPVRTTIR